MRRAISALPAYSIRLAILAAVGMLLFVLTACGGETTEGDDVATDPDPTQTEVSTEEPAPEPTTPSMAPEDTPMSEPEPTVEPTAEPTVPAEGPEETEQSEPQPAVNLAPELAGLTDWQNSEPTTLEQLRGEPVVLVFWNSI